MVSFQSSSYLTYQQHLNHLISSCPWNTFSYLASESPLLGSPLLQQRRLYILLCLEPFHFLISKSCNAQASSLSKLIPFVILSSPMALISSKCWKFTNLYLQHKPLSPKRDSYIQLLTQQLHLDVHGYLKLNTFKAKFVPPSVNPISVNG